MSDKQISNNFSYDWELSYSILKKCNLFSLGENKIESVAFGPLSSPEKFVLLLKTNIFSKLFDSISHIASKRDSVQICLKLSNNEKPDYKIESYKLTMLSNNKTCLSFDPLNKPIRYITHYDLIRNINPEIWFALDESKSKVIFHCEIRYSFVDCKGICAKSYHTEELFKSLKLTFEKKQFTDIIIRTSDQKEFPAHKMILASRSPVFETMFSNPEFIENKENLVWIKDIDSKIMKQLLDYIYYGDISFNDETAFKLILPAHKYSIKPLIEICERIMLNKLEKESAVELLNIADTYDLFEMKMEAIQFICQNKELFDDLKKN